MGMTMMKSGVMMLYCDQGQPAPEPRSDIENVWTLLAFFAPACVVFAAQLFRYLFLHVPLSQSATWDIDPVDVVVLQWVRSLLGRVGFNFQYLDQAHPVAAHAGWFNQFILTLADVHMGFGLAILGYGLASLSEGLTAYDWWLVVALAWLALITNISVLFGLGDFFRFNPTKRTWRLCLVVLMFTTLAFCLVPVGRMRQVILHDKENSLNILSSNVLCFFPGHGRDLSVEISGQVVLSWSVVLGLLIAIAVVSVAVMLLERPHGIMVKWCEHYRGEMREYLSGDHLSCARCEQRFILLVIRPFIAFWLTLRTYLDLMNSLIFQITCTGLSPLWISLRYLDILDSEPFGKLGTVFGFSHFIAFFTLVAPLKPLVEYICMICGDRARLVSLSWTWRRDTNLTGNPAATAGFMTVGDGKVGFDDADVPSTSEEAAMNRDPVRLRRRAKPTTIPLRFKFYLDTTWYVKALPIAGGSVLVQLLLMFVLVLLGKKSPIEAITTLLVWFLAFAPSQVFFFILVAMVFEERGKSEARTRMAYQVASATFSILCAGVAFDTTFGFGGYPMSYFGLAIVGVLVVTYVLHGFVSKPGSIAKGKGVSVGGVDEETGLLGARTRNRIPVRRSKHLHGPSRRLRKQSIKSYGTMGKPAN